MRCKYVLAALLLVAVVVFYAGCGDSQDDLAADSKDGKQEMVLNHILFTKVQNLDPGNMRGVYSMMVGGQIFEPLYVYHFLKRPYEIVPLLADGMPQISDDHLTYTIKIKKGIRFQDDQCFADGNGREVTAHDFIYAWKRIANMKFVSQNWSIFDDKIVGLDEFREYTKQFEDEFAVDYSKEVEGLTTLDDYTIQIKLKKPWPQILESALSDVSTSPMAKEAVDNYRKNIINKPVGTGPFKLKTWRRGSYIELVRNENFREDFYPTEGGPGDVESGMLDDAGKKVPFADRAIWRVVVETQPAWLEFMKGNVDGMGIPKDNFGEAVNENMELTGEMADRNISLKTFNDPSVYWVGFNMKDPILGKNKPLRMAISRAVDRQKFIDLFMNGRDRIAHGFIAPGLNSYDESIKEAGYSKHDIEEAKQLLKEAEEVNGGPIPVLELGMPGTDTFSRQYGQFLQNQLSNAGIELDVEYMDWPTYMGKINTGSLQIFASGVSAGLPDSLDFLGMFATKYFPPAGNKFYYSNSEFDELYDKVEVMFPSDERMANYKKMERMVMDDYIAVFINHRIAYTLQHDWYKNYKPHVFSYGFTKYRRIDLQKRGEYKDLLKSLKKKKD